MSNFQKLYHDFSENIMEFLDEFKKREYSKITKRDFDNHFLARWEADLKVLAGEAHDTEVNKDIALILEILKEIHVTIHQIHGDEPVFFESVRGYQAKSRKYVIDSFTVHINFLRQRLGYLDITARKKGLLKE